MIPFDEIDSRLKRIGKDRAWLAEVTGRSAGSIRAALAPNALPKHRSGLLQKALSDAIESEEGEKGDPDETHERLILKVSEEQFEAYNRASLSEGKTIKEWIMAVLEEAAQGENTFGAAKESKLSPGELAAQMYEERLQRESEKTQHSKSE